MCKGLTHALVYPFVHAFVHILMHALVKGDAGQCRGRMSVAGKLLGRVPTGDLPWQRGLAAGRGGAGASHPAGTQPSAAAMPALGPR